MILKRLEALHQLIKLLDFGAEWQSWFKRKVVALQNAAVARLTSFETAGVTKPTNSIKVLSFATPLLEILRYSSRFKLI
jgi:hypothetical protein